MNRVVSSGLAALGVLAVLSLASPACAQSEGDDVIRKRDNTTQQGKVQSEDLKGCVVRIGGADITLSWKDIKSIDYAGSPDFKRARAYVDSGSMGDAVPLLEILAKQDSLRLPLKNHVLNLLGSCHVRVGDLDQAIARYNELFKAFPKSQFLIFGGGENLINAYLAKGKAQDAQAAFDNLIAGAKSAGADTTALNVLRGRVQEASGDFASAAASYKAMADAAADEGAKATAELGIARCLFGQKKAAEAEAKYRGLVARDLPWLVLAGAWNGLGDIAYQNAAAKRDAEGMTNALFSYLRGCVLYTPQPGESTTEYERAVRGAYDCFRGLSELEAKDDKKKSVFASRARDRLELLQTKFPGSRYIPDKK